MQLNSYVQDALLDLNQVLGNQGAQAALAFLNARVPHRFTAINLLEDDHMVCVLLHDKEQKLTAGDMEKIPFSHSFCQFAIQDNAMFTTANSSDDARLTAHPYQGVMLSYCGVPLDNAAGGLLGTLCHMDYQSLTLSEQEFDVFQRAARVFPKYLPRSRK